jgi:hypothetical protein
MGSYILSPLPLRFAANNSKLNLPLTHKIDGSDACGTKCHTRRAYTSRHMRDMVKRLNGAAGIAFLDRKKVKYILQNITKNRGTLENMTFSIVPFHIENLCLYTSYTIWELQFV